MKFNPLHDRVLVRRIEGEDKTKVETAPGVLSRINDGIVDGCRRAAEPTGMTWGQIPDVSPHLPAADCTRAMQQVFEHDLSHCLPPRLAGRDEAEAARLYESPFTDLTPHGPDGLFRATEMDELLRALPDVRETAVAA